VLRLLDVNTGAHLAVAPFTLSGEKDVAAFSTLKRFMRCRRSGHEREMSPSLIALLGRIAQRFGDPVLHVISAHRRADGAVTSKTSQHAVGKAADIRIPGVSLKALQRAAFDLGARGIGLYPVSGFVHVDVRAQPYYWREDGAGAMAVRIAP
jgi:uncharacterized protein YcbK (DUF882 family)